MKLTAEQRRKIALMKKKLKEGFYQRNKCKTVKVTEPRYDEDYFKFVAWLDENG